MITQTEWLMIWITLGVLTVPNALLFAVVVRDRRARQRSALDDVTSRAGDTQ